MLAQQCEWLFRSPALRITTRIKLLQIGGYAILHILEMIKLYLFRSFTHSKYSSVLSHRSHESCKIVIWTPITYEIYVKFHEQWNKETHNEYRWTPNEYSHDAVYFISLKTDFVTIKWIALCNKEPRAFKCCWDCSTYILCDRITAITRKIKFTKVVSVLLVKVVQVSCKPFWPISLPPTSLSWHPLDGTDLSAPFWTM